jgi:SAM-dependent methyltransferase
MEYCKPYFQDKKEILEIGSGAGQALFYFEGRGYHVTGIEPDFRNVELINKKLKHGSCISGYVEDMIINGVFDVIWISHVFEHLIRPDLLLKKCKANLRDDGIIFIEVPECENPKILRESIYDNPSSFHFTKRTLSNVVQNAGYKILRCDSLRVPTVIEAGTVKVMRRIFGFMRYKPYPYYPRIVTHKNDGQMIRMILAKS